MLLHDTNPLYFCWWLKILIGQVARHSMGVEEFPIASENRVDFAYPGDHSGKASYPLAKAHG